MVLVAAIVLLLVAALVLLVAGLEILAAGLVLLAAGLVLLAAGLVLLAAGLVLLAAGLVLLVNTLWCSCFAALVLLLCCSGVSGVFLKCSKISRIFDASSVLENGQIHGATWVGVHRGRVYFVKMLENNVYD